MIVEIERREIEGRAKQAIIDSGVYTEDQINRFKEGKFKPAALKAVITALTNLSKPYVDEDVLAVREILAQHGINRNTLKSGNFDSDPLFKLAMTAYQAARPQAATTAE